MTLSAFNTKQFSSDRIRHPLDRINVAVLSLLGEGSLASLFWTLALTGSIGAAATIMFLSYAGNYLRQLAVYITR